LAPAPASAACRSHSTRSWRKLPAEGVEAGAVVLLGAGERGGEPAHPASSIITANDASFMLAIFLNKLMLPVPPDTRT